ncbi:MAG: hypothetical protein KC502_00290 [Myxococcales bacterium]|nr:hypothetical protein [Myxococcales bacterium]
MLSPQCRIGSMAMFSNALCCIALLSALGCSPEPEVKPDAGTTGADAVDTNGGVEVVQGDTDEQTDTDEGDTGGADECKVDKDCDGKIKYDETDESNLCKAPACVAGKCELKAKATGADCDDGKGCTDTDKCNGQGECKGVINCKAEVCNEPICLNDGTCSSKAIPVALKEKCDDGNACTENDLCGFGSCGGTAFDVQTKCDDDESCTTESCDKDKGCLSTPKDKGVACTDENACTDSDKCDDKGKCQAGTPVKCTASSACSNAKCDKVKGCYEEPYQNGVTCNDGDKCTEKDECQGGKCKGDLIAAAIPPNSCILLSCNKTTGKVTSTNAANGKVCSDEDPCTDTDKCANGICKGKVRVCNDSKPCTIDACNKKTGICEAPAVKDGTKCDDGNKCTEKDGCLKGVCTGDNYTTSGACDDKNPCTNDGCSPQSGCFHVPKAGVFCDDGNKCTELDKCVTGKCKGVAAKCSDNQPCTNDSCDDKTGKCVHTTFDGPCDDGNKCTTDDVCTKGKCGGKTVTCNDDNTCTTDVCDTVTGCKFIPLKGGSPCNDGVSCTLNDQCDLGKCKGTDTCVTCDNDLKCIQFDDGNPCNGVARCADSPKGKVCQVDPKSIVTCDPADDPACGANICDPKTGKCQLNKKQEGVVCTSNNKCLSLTTCSESGTCEGTTKDCDDDEVCTVDSCDPKVGCKNVAKKDGTSCDDGSVCTAGEACKSGACYSEPSQNKCKCDSDGDCTKFEDGDLCNGVQKCIGKLCIVGPATKVTCDPSKATCTENLCVKKTGKCVLTPKKDGTICDDGSKCTIQDACKGGKCFTAAKLSCDDNNACTVDACGPIAGCVHGNISEGGQCDDGNVCTESDKCKSGKCAGAKKDCGDDNPCTVDLCDTKSGKCTAVLDNNQSCSDGDPCTIGDKCLDGVCKAADLKCDDGNPCTVDGCDGKGGCLNKLELGKDCDDGNDCTALDRCSIEAKCVGKKKDCDDGSACTTDSCVKGACVVQAAVGKACDDGNKCTEKDACDNKGQCSATLVKCDDGNVCTKVAGPCSPVNGCTVVPDDGKNCADGNACTYLDKCKNGSCEGTAVNCNDNNVCTTDNCDAKTGCVNKQNTCDDENDCTFDKCDNKKGCLHSDLDGFQPCKDGNPCTEKGVCNKGKCESKIKSCDDENVCTTDKCNPKTKDDDGGCVNLPVEDTATKCDDDKACTKDNCDGKGKCKSVPLDCDDSNACTTDACVTGKGCQYTDLKDNKECDDGNVCSKASVCHGGTCIAKDNDACIKCKTTKDCSGEGNNNACDGQHLCVKKKPSDTFGDCIFDKTVVECDSTTDTACAKNTCNTLTGTCAVTQLVNGSKCDDDQPCTVGDSCTNGECKPVGQVDCSSVANDCNSSACLIDAKSESGYTCVALPKAGTIVCDADGDPCTAGDTCDNGKCNAGKDIDCSAVAGECELAACVKGDKGGFTCKIKPAPDGAKCDDGQLCTAGDACKTGKCQAGTGTYDCSGDINETCATGVCDKTNNGGKGGCTAKPKNNGGECNSDDNGCTTGDKCAAGVCVPGVPPDCNAKTSACTQGACKSTGKTTYSCIAAPVKESKPCEADKNGCTLDDKCLSGKCVPGKMKDCSSLDGSGGCQIGACEPISSSQGKCVSKPAKTGVPCDADGNGCTQNDACNGKGACQPGTAVNCLKQTSGCGQGTCKSVSKDKFECSTDAKPKGTKCDADADGCTIDDTCDGAGKCVAGKAPDCSKEDKGACIVGGCTNKGSTLYICEAYPKKNGETCDADKNGCTVKDSCQFGFCNPGVLETCKNLQSECASAKCETDGATAFKCKVTPVVSYPPLTKTQICDPKAKPGDKGACSAGYKCDLPAGSTADPTCIPTVTVSCNDGDKCVQTAICEGGLCKPAEQKDCDDKDPCTLDACKDGTCSNVKIQGCGTCLAQGFEADLLTGVALQAYDKAMVLERVAGGAPEGTSSMGWKWDGTKDAKATDTAVDISARIVLRRLYLEANAAQSLTFSYKATATNEGCADVMVNGKSVWQKCGAVAGSEKSGYQAQTVSLAAYAGQSVDIAFSVAERYTKKTKGEIRVDDIKVRGKCAASCMGTDLEVPSRGGSKLAKARAVPQPWRLKADAVNFLSWKVNDKDGHSGSASLRAAWSGGSPDGKSYGASITVPGITVLTDTKLYFALRAKTLGEAGCGGDTLTVTVNGSKLYQACDKSANWKAVAVDLKSFAGKTVDVVITAAAGKTKSAAGVFEIDDVAVTGKCTYLCYHETFNGSLGSLKSGALPANSTTWAYVTDNVVSKPGAARVVHTKSTNVGVTSMLDTAADYPATMTVPVMGASMEMQVNLFIKGKPEGCLEPFSKGYDPTKAPAFIGVLTSQVVDATLPKQWQTAVPLSSRCQSSSGYSKHTMPFSDTLNGTEITPMIVGNRVKGVDELKFYVDDIKMLCK